MQLEDGSAIPRDPDQLVVAAHKALAAGEAQKAVALFREATRLAPFRKDLRDGLSEALQASLTTKGGRRDRPSPPEMRLGGDKPRGRTPEAPPKPAPPRPERPQLEPGAAPPRPRPERPQSEPDAAPPRQRPERPQSEPGAAPPRPRPERPRPARPDGDIPMTAAERAVMERRRLRERELARERERELERERERERPRPRRPMPPPMNDMHTVRPVPPPRQRKGLRSLLDHTDTFKRQRAPFKRSSTRMPGLWFVGLTLMACVAATAYIFTKVPVRDMIISWRMSPQERQAREYFQVAQAEWADGRYEAVIRMVDEALPQVGAYGADLVAMQARAHEALGDQLRRGPHEDSEAEAEALEGAIAKYETALEVGGETPGLVFKLGEVHYLRADVLRLELGAAGSETWKGRFRQAEDYLKKAIELDSRNLEAYNKLGITYIRLDRSFEAYAHWASVIELAPRSSHAAEARRQLEQNNQNVEAILEQRRASRNTP